MAIAREQHAVLVSALRGLGVDVLELAPDEGSAESVYTQDLAVVVNGIALMCRPGPHRQAEVGLQGLGMKEIRSRLLNDSDTPKPRILVK